jgi:hypothetical protein
MIVFGGGTDSGLSNEVWALELSPSLTWVPLTVAGTPPAARSYHCAVYDPTGDRVVVFGGSSTGASYTDDAWELAMDPSPTWAPLAQTGARPYPRSGHSGVYDAIRDRMVVFGGEIGGSAADTWALQLGASPQWTEISPLYNPLPPRLLHAAIFDPVADRMVVYGGLTEYATRLGDRWSLHWAGALDVGGSRPATLRVSLGAPFPNPLRAGVRIPFALPSERHVEISIVDVSGRQVRALVKGSRPPGRHVVEWDGRDQSGGRPAAGVYFVDLRAGAARSTRRIVLLP